MNPLNGSAIGYRSFSFTRPIALPNDEIQKGTSQPLQRVKARPTEQREVFSLNETRAETYRPGGESHARIRGDRGSVIDVLV